MGFLVVAGFLLLSYWHKLTQTATAGATTEMSGLATFLVGALVCYGHFWIATTLGVASLLLLDLKTALEKPGCAHRPARDSHLRQVPVPERGGSARIAESGFGPFHINPFKTWLVVVAISAISYASYVLQKLTKGQGGIVLAALLGGAYSSTVTTVVLARQGKTANQPHLFSGGILMASGVMYVRLVILLALFNRQLMAALWLPFLVLACVAVGFGWLWTRRGDKGAQALTSGAGAEESAGADHGISVCSAVSGDAGGYATGRKISRQRRSGYAGGHHGRQRR